MPPDRTKTPSTPKLNVLYQKLQEPGIPFNQKKPIISYLCRTRYPANAASIEAFFSEWLNQENEDEFNQRIESFVKSAKVPLLQKNLDKIDRWIFSSNSSQEFMRRLTLIENLYGVVTIVQEIAQHLIHWIEEGIILGSDESSHRILWVFQLSRFTKNIIEISIKNSQFPLIDALINCCGAIPLCLWTYMPISTNKHFDRVFLILSSKYERLITTILPYLVGWVFNENITFPTQLIRLQLVVNSKCNLALTEIGQCIAGWVFDQKNLKYTKGIEFILNSDCQQLIEIILPCLCLWVKHGNQHERLEIIRLSKCKEAFALTNRLLASIASNPPRDVPVQRSTFWGGALSFHTQGGVSSSRVRSEPGFAYVPSEASSLHAREEALPPGTQDAPNSFRAL